MLFDIKRFAINDGPGIRVTFFMKGCPLHCIWCHNPEGIGVRREKLFNKKKCIGCQSCVKACEASLLHLSGKELDTASLDSFSREETGSLSYRRLSGEGECLMCGACADACPTRALEVAGREWSLSELMMVVEKERAVMTESGGGVTLCGGEPLMHPDEALAILQELGSRGIHRCVDTTLYATSDVVRRVASACELFLVDLKHMDSVKHKRYTGVPNEQILSNIRLVSEMQKSYWIRIPLIVGVNADEENLRLSARFLSSLATPPEVVNLLVYHDIGKGKHERLGTTYNPDGIPMSAPSAEQQQAALRIFEEEGLLAKIGG